MSQRPIILITTECDPNDRAERYCAAIERAGGEPVVIKPTEPVPSVDEYDGLLVSGGGDVNPCHYGEEKHPRTYWIEDERDAQEFALLRAALEARRPILGVCRGFQIINVAMGGKLIQHIDGHGSFKMISRQHDVTIEPDSKLARILGVSGRVLVNSRHHQALSEAELAPGLRINAHGPVGFAEGIETISPDQWLIGLQCHPERSQEVDPRFVHLFTDFVEQARAVQRRRLEQLVTS